MMSVFGPGVSDLIRSFHAMMVGNYNSGFVDFVALLHTVALLNSSAQTCLDGMSLVQRIFCDPINGLCGGRRRECIKCVICESCVCDKTAKGGGFSFSFRFFSIRDTNWHYQCRIFPSSSSSSALSATPPSSLVSFRSSSILAHRNLS